MSVCYPKARLDDCLARLVRHREAEPLLLRSYRRARGTSAAAQSPGLLNDFRKRIIAYYDLSGQPERAAFWRAEEIDAAIPIDPFAR